MGLDVYVGSFSRYYAQDWETVIQQAGREQGFTVEVVGRALAPEDTADDRASQDLEALVRQLEQSFTVETVRRDSAPADAVIDPRQAAEMIAEWRSGLAVSLRDAGQVTGDVDWNESVDAPYFTDKPAWDCYGALQLLAAYEESEKPVLGRRWPKQLADDWETDGRLRDRLKAKNPPRYAHLYGCEIWLPLDLTAPFTGPRPTGQETRFGSSLRLLDELRLLNQRTYQGTPDDLSAWRQAMPDGHDERFEPKAKTGLSIMLALSAAAVEHRLPMLLDY